MAVYKAKKATKDGRIWYFSVGYLAFNGEKKRKKSRRYMDEEEAQKAEEQFLNDLSYNRTDMTFKEMYYQYIEYIEESIKGSTKYCKNNRVKNHVLPNFGKLNINDITFNTVIAWKGTMNKATYGKRKKKYALSYKQTLFKELKAALNYGVDFCGLKENVASKAKTFSDKSEAVITDEEKIRYITPEEYNLFTSVIEKNVFKVFFAFLYYMGVRKGEAQALNWNDILWSTDKVRIIKTITNKTDEVDENGYHFKITNTKNRKNRTIKMPQILKNMLLELYQYYMDFEGFNDNWFVFGGYRHLPSQSIDNEKDYYFKLVKEMYGKAINRITNHEFRHSHASYLISKGVKIELIAYRLGDTVAVVESIYAHLFPETENEIIEELDLIQSSYVINSKTIEFAKKKEILISLPA